MTEEDKILDSCAQENMFNWDLNEFKTTYPSLYKTIVCAMKKMAVAVSEPKPEAMWVLRTYHLQLKHDKGVINLTTSGCSYANVVEKVKEAEGCPESAIVKIWT